MTHRSTLRAVLFFPLLLGSVGCGATRNERVVTPLVANLNDDDGDGVVGVCDDADVVLVAYDDASIEGRIYVLKGANGALQAESEEPVLPFVTPAIGDLDGDGVPEIVTLGMQGQLLFFDGSGKKLREGDSYDASEGQYGAFALANLDARDTPEIVFGSSIFDSNGRLKVRLTDSLGSSAGYGHATLPIDLDGDGDLEVILGRSAFHHDGRVYYERPELAAGLPSVSDLDGDMFPEVLVQSEYGLTVLQHDGTPLISEVRPLFALSGPPSHQRPACHADVDGDGRPELGISSGAAFGILRDDLTVLRSYPIVDESGASGCSAFDFGGRGESLVFHFDEQRYFVFGAQGQLLSEGERSSQTAIELPVVADINGDGGGELLLVGGVGWDGVHRAPTLRVLSTAFRGLPVRRIWNQHAYHITNARENGAIPEREEPHWRAQNGFRRNGYADGDRCTKPVLPG